MYALTAKMRENSIIIRVIFVLMDRHGQDVSSGVTEKVSHIISDTLDCSRNIL